MTDDSNAHNNVFRSLGKNVQISCQLHIHIHSFISKLPSLYVFVPFNLDAHVNKCRVHIRQGHHTESPARFVPRHNADVLSTPSLVHRSWYKRH